MNSGADSFQSIVEHLNTPLIVVSASAGTIRYGNQAAEEVFGLTRRALLDLPASQLFRQPGQLEEMVAEMSQRGEAVRQEVLVRGAENAALAMEITLDSIFFHDDAAIVITFHDVSRLRKIEGELRITAQIEKLLSALSQRFIAVDSLNMGEALSDALEQIAEVVLADSGFFVMLEDAQKAVKALHHWTSDIGAGGPPPIWEQLLERELPWVVEQVGCCDVVQVTSREFDRWPGEDVPSFSLVMVPVYYDSALHGVLGFSSGFAGKRWKRAATTLTAVSQTLANVLHRQHVETALAEERELLAVTLGSIADAVIATDRDSRIRLFNRHAERLTGWTRQQAVGKRLQDVFRRRDLSSGLERPNPVSEVLERGLVVNAESELIAADGKAWPIEESAAPIRGPNSEVIGVVVAFADVSERREAEREREKSNKLEAVGLLAGGIAHDFRNILLLILGNASLAEYSLDSPEKTKKLLAEVKAAAHRAKELTEQLLTFSKGGAPVRMPTSVADLVKESVAFCLRGSNVVCKTEVSVDLRLVEVDAGQINQVLNNLLINADQAMPAGGKVWIEAYNADPETVAEAGLLGKYVTVVVRDEGPGIPAEVIDKIFDPYFTTKDEGTGLGLATAHSIIKAHDGCLLVDSEPDVGTAFTVFLPAAISDETVSDESDELLALGSGRVLVVDDERPILELAEGMLSTLGYDPHTVTDGTEAIAVYQAAHAHDSPFDVVLMDLTIPGGLGGKEAAAAIREIDPDAKIIVSSGYSQDPVMADFKSYGFIDVLPKPFVITELGKVLRRVLKP